MANRSVPKSSSLELALTRAWRRRGILACALWPLSLLFRALSGARRACYAAGLLASTRLPLPVIVVGNIFVGGTGKTPFTIWLIDALRRAGYAPGVVSRGHGGKLRAPAMVTPDADPREAGDEPVLIAQRSHAPVCVGSQRAAAARLLMEMHPEVDVIVSDDGLQHYALARDIEIVVSDARGAGNGWLLPAGPLREPASRRRDFTVVNAAHAPAGAFRMQLAGDHAEPLCDPSRRVPLSELRQGNGAREKRIVAAAGIGHPERFFSMLRGQGLVFGEMPLPDHHEFSADSFAAVQADLILITEKDAVKCRRIDALKSDPRLWVVPVAAQVDDALAERIVEKLRGHPTA